MALSFDQFINLPDSEKTLLVWMHPRKRLIGLWDDSNAPTYSQNVDYYVTKVLVDKAELTLASSSTLGAGEYFFDSATKKIYVRLADNSDPRLSFTVAEFRLFFSDSPYNLPYDLNSGREVEYIARIPENSSIAEELDSDDLTGIALAGSTSFSLRNADNYFSSIYEKLFWDKTKVNVFLWSPKINVSDKKQIFSGFVSDRSYGQNVRFSLKDFLEVLRYEIPLPVYSESDGYSIPSDFYGLPKRRVYGRVDGLKCRSLDQTLDGYALTGTFSSSAPNTILASGADLFTELSQGDEVFYTNLKGDEVKFRVKSIANNGLSFDVEDDIESGFLNQSFTVRPEKPYRKNNRNWFITSHEIAEPTTAISTNGGLQVNRVILDDITDLEAGDTIFFNIGGVLQKNIIRRISENEVVLRTAFNEIPPDGTVVTKSPIQKVFFGRRELVLDRDYTINNSGGECKILLDDLAEVNVTEPVAIRGTSLLFTNGSRSVVGTGTSFKDDISPRDWIKPDGTGTYYEVIEVTDDTNLKISIPFSDATTDVSSKIKRVAYVDDNSTISVNCLGKTEGTKTSKWIKTAAGVVKDLLQEQGLTSELNLASFALAESEAPQLVSISVPLGFSDEKPIVREPIDLLNESVFGSLHKDENQLIKYSVLSPKKEEISDIIGDDDLASRNFNLQSSGRNIARKISVNYRHFDVDRFSNESGSFSESFINDYIDKISDLTREEPREIYVYRQSDAVILAQRIGLLRESANNILTLRTKLKFINKPLNSVLYFEIKNLPERFGTPSDQNRIGMISKISKDGKNTILEITDLSGMFSKVCTITANNAKIYDDSDAAARAQNGFIVDNFELLQDNPDTYRTNLIG